MQLPVRFGKYQLEKFLGGGMSHVYKATDTVLGRQVAVKILTDDGCRNEDAKKRFLLEARMCGNISHDNIIRIHDYGEQDGRPFIVMEFLVGQDLRDAIDQHKTGDVRKKIDIALQAARALGYVHTLNIVHRDIKPENLHIDTTGRVRLMDFGIAKAANLSLTRTGFAIGTPYYMAPEQVLGKPVTATADIYSYGILLYELLTGLKPVTGENLEAVFYQVLNQPLNMEPLKAAGVPQSLQNLVAQCTAKKSEDRIASFDLIATQLESILYEAGGPPTQTGQPRMTQQTRPLPTGAVTAPHPTAQEPSIKNTGLAGVTQAEEKPKSKVPLIAAVATGIIALSALAIYLLQPKVPDPPLPKKKDPVVQNDPPPDPPDKPALASVIKDANGGELLLVPAGPFPSGEARTPKQLPAFYMDRTEVSVAEWNRFCEATGCKAKAVAGGQDLPVTSVTFNEASAYCAWAGTRLPTGDEFEKASRGEQGFKYVWGGEDDPGKANVKGNPAGKLQPVTAMMGVGPYGMLNLAGNAWEWVQQTVEPSEFRIKSVKVALATAKLPPYAAGEPWAAYRGGGIDFPVQAATSWEFFATLARYHSPTVGFRCAADPK